MATESSRPFAYSAEVSGHTITVKCHGRVVSDGAGEATDQADDPQVPRIVLDLSDVSFIDVLVRSRSGGHLVCCDQGGTTPVMRA